MTKDWTWVAREAVRAIHDRQLAEHGGGAGLSDEGLLLSALARPENTALYGEPDLADLAAAYAFGIAKNHPFVDGAKRTAWVVARVFLAINGATLKFDPMDAISAMEQLAARAVDETTLATWFRTRINPRAS